MSIVKQLLALVLIALTAADEGTEHVVQHQQQHRHRRSVASCLLEARVTGFEVSNSTERSDKSSSCRRAKVWPVSCLFTPIDFIDTTAAIESCFHCCFAYHARRLAALGDALDGPDDDSRSSRNNATRGEKYRSIPPLVGPMMHPPLGGGLTPFLEFLNSTNYVTVWTMSFFMNGENGMKSLVQLLAKQRRPVLITMADLQLPRPSGKAYSPPDAATEKGLNGTVGHWFATNPDVYAYTHPRVHDFPIGLKTGTAIHRFRERLDAVRSKPAAALPEEPPRPNLLMCCCMANHKGTRPAKRQILIDNGFNCSATGLSLRVSEDDYFAMMSRSKFVFSPQGRGVVNWRDLESVFLGAIPLVDARVLNPRWHPDDFPVELWNGTVLEELPVVRVSNWSAVTPSSLERIWASVTAHRRRKYQEELLLSLPNEQERQERQEERQKHVIHRRPLLDTGENGALVGTDLRRAWTPYHLGRVIAALGHCRWGSSSSSSSSSKTKIMKEGKALASSPWWCDPGWRTTGDARGTSSSSALGLSPDLPD